MVVVVGMARSGLGVTRLLRTRGIEVLATDLNPSPPLEGEFRCMGVSTKTGTPAAQDLLVAEEIVVSPGVPLDLPELVEAQRHGVGVVGELEVACRYLRGEIVAVTGSNGKTTTTLLTAHILRAAGRPVEVGGNIGTPVSDLVETARDDTINVIEVSSFQLDSTRAFRPTVGVILNITPDHLDRYADFEAYRNAKFRLLINQGAEDVAIFNRDDARTFPLPDWIQSRQRFFSRKQRIASGADLRNGILSVKGRAVMDVEAIPLRGSHNVENVLASILVAEIFDVSPACMATAVRTFQGVEHRLESVGSIEGIEFVNDSKATNVDSAVKAVESFPNNIILIVGGKDKGASFRPLIEASVGRVRQILTLGSAAEKFERQLGGLIPAVRVESMADAVRRAVDLGRPGDVVLLSPACASFDMYANYEERGMDFKKSVEAVNASLDEKEFRRVRP